LLRYCNAGWSPLAWSLPLLSRQHASWLPRLSPSPPFPPQHASHARPKQGACQCQGQGLVKVRVRGLSRAGSGLSMGRGGREGEGGRTDLRLELLVFSPQPFDICTIVQDAPSHWLMSLSRASLSSACKRSAQLLQLMHLLHHCRLEGGSGREGGREGGRDTLRSVTAFLPA
jgi:hypothetical protein